MPCGWRGAKSTVMESSRCRWDTLEALGEYLDLVFYDIKLMDPERHKAYTGVSNRRILNNAIKLFEKAVPIIIRIPLIAGINDNREDLLEAMEFLKKHDRKGAVRTVELLPYHKLGTNKYRALGREGELGDLSRPGSAFVDEAKHLVRSYGFEVRIEEI
jgi:pyruvate formate lyase activating enzyme